MCLSQGAACNRERLDGILDHIRELEGIPNRSKGPSAVKTQSTECVMSNILWIVLIGFIAGIIARFLAPGPNGPQGFILTTVIGIAGAFLSTFIGQTVGWYRLDQGAGL